MNTPQSNNLGLKRLVDILHTLCEKPHLSPLLPPITLEEVQAYAPFLQARIGAKGELLSCTPTPTGESLWQLYKTDLAGFDDNTVIKQIETMIQTQGQQGIILAPTDLIAAKVAQRLRDHGSRVGEIFTHTPQEQRQKIYDQMSAGELEVVITSQAPEELPALSNGAQASPNSRASREKSQAKKRSQVEKKQLTQGNTEAPEDWRQLTDPDLIVQRFPRRPKADEIIELYERNKVLQSESIAQFLKQLASEMTVSCSE